jgi:adenosylhomocysteine nucleosidase
MTGVGPVEAAVAVTRTLAALQAAGALPDIVVSLGSAGSARLPKTRVYQVSEVAYRDMDASVLGFAKGETPFLGLPRAVALGLRVPGIEAASLSTGANVVSGGAYAAIAEDMVDMETFAVLRACQSFGVELVAFRGISDGDAELAEIMDWTEHLHVIDRNLAHACEALRRYISTSAS